MVDTNVRKTVRYSILSDRLMCVSGNLQAMMIA